jgi:hypothetical protein
MSYPDTSEQTAIIDWEGERLVVKVFAGTGKTPTLVLYFMLDKQFNLTYINKLMFL